MKRINFNHNKGWLGSRGIGGTDASAICGVNKYQDANDVYNRLVYGIYQNQSNSATSRGNLLEDAVVRLWQLNNPNYKIIEPPQENWLFCHDEFEFITGSFDRIIEDENGEQNILEIKTLQGSKEEWEDNKVPIQYLFQTLHYLLISNFKYAKIVCLHISYDNTEFELIERTIKREDYQKEIERLLKIEVNFYQNCVKKIRPKTFIHIPLVN